MLHRSNPLPHSWDLLRTIICEPNVDQRFVEHIHTLKRSPHHWTMKLGKLFVNTAVRDPACRKYLLSSWDEIVDLIAEQVAHNRLIYNTQCLSSDARSPVSKVASQKLYRKFHQMPCTKDTAHKRLHIAKKYCDYDDHILVLGDDDMISLVLAEAGFKNVTAVDIDPRVVNELSFNTQEKNLPLRLFQQDLTKPLPHELKQSYKMIFLDPAYSIEGIRFFLKAASESTYQEPGTLYFLSVHLMSLFKKGFEELHSQLNMCNLEVINFYPAFNTYPIPARLKTLIGIANNLVIRSKFLGPKNPPLDFFTSDALLLKQK